jgi:hypothetical protein
MPLLYACDELSSSDSVLKPFRLQTGRTHVMESTVRTKLMTTIAEISCSLWNTRQFLRTRWPCQASAKPSIRPSGIGEYFDPVRAARALDTPIPGFES